MRGYISIYGGKLVLTEVMDFAWNYYAEVEEKSTGIHAMELLTLKGDQVEGMLSVNGYTGAVWYHSWHGSFLGMREYEH